MKWTDAELWQGATAIILSSIGLGLFLASSGDGIHLFDDQHGTQQIVLTTSFLETLLLWLPIAVFIVTVSWMVCSWIISRLSGCGFWEVAYLDALSYVPLAFLGIAPLRYIPVLAKEVTPLFLLAGTLLPAQAFIALLLVLALKFKLHRPNFSQTSEISIPGKGISDRQVGWIVFIVAAVAFAVAAHFFNLDRGLGGDEPHYMIVAHSIVEDGDIYIEDDHVDQAWRGFTNIPIEPQYVRRTVDDRIVPIHRIGLPLLAALPYAALGSPGGMLLIVLLAAAAAANTFWLVVKIVPNRGVALLSTGWVVLSVPAMPMSLLFFTEIPLAAFTLASLNLILQKENGAPRWPWLAALLIWVLPWIHARGWVMAAALSLLLIYKLRQKRFLAIALTVFVVLLALAPPAWNWWLYGEFSLLAEMGEAQGRSVSLMNVLKNFGGLVFDQEFGLLLYNPAVVLAAAGLIPLWRRSRIGTVVVLLVVICTLGPGLAYRMWWGGGSSPARYAAPIFHLAAIPFAALLDDKRFRSWRNPSVILMAISIALAVVLMTHPDMLYNLRDGTSGMLTAVSAGPFDAVEWWPSWFDGLPVFWTCVGSLAFSAILTVIAIIIPVRLVRKCIGEKPWTVAFSSLVGMAACTVVFVLHGWSAQRLTPGEPNGFQPRSRESDLLFLHRYRHDAAYQIIDLTGNLKSDSVPPRGFSAQRLFPPDMLIPDIKAPRGRSLRIGGGKPELHLEPEVPLWAGDYELRIWLRSESGAGKAAIQAYDLADAGLKNTDRLAEFRADLTEDLEEIRCPLNIRDNSRGVLLRIESEHTLRFTHLFLAGRSLQKLNSWPLPAELFDQVVWRFSDNEGVEGRSYKLFCEPEAIFKPEGSSFWLRGDSEATITIVTESPFSVLHLDVSGHPQVSGEISSEGHLLPISFEPDKRKIKEQLPVEAENHGKFWLAKIRVVAKGTYIPANHVEGSEDRRELGFFLKIVPR